MLSQQGFPSVFSPVSSASQGWRHQMETFSALLAICAGNSPVSGELPPQRPVTRSFDVFFDLLLNKRLSKQSWRWWFETPCRSLWRHCNAQKQKIRLSMEPKRNRWIKNRWINSNHGYEIYSVLIAINPFWRFLSRSKILCYVFF